MVFFMFLMPRLQSLQSREFTHMLSLKQFQSIQLDFPKVGLVFKTLDNSNPSEPKPQAFRLTVSTLAPPTFCSVLLFPIGSQSEQSSLKGRGTVARQL